MPYSGVPIDRAEWLDATTIRVRFRSTFTGRNHQLYAGRTLIGETSAPTSRVVTGTVRPSDAPQPLQLLAVSAGELGTDFGTRLPVRPYNRVKLSWTASGFPADTKLFEVRAGTTPGGAVDANNVLARVPFKSGVTSYGYTTDPLDGTGTWNFEIVARDNRPADGNAGTALAIAAVVLAYPADVTLNSDGSRLDVSVSGGTATVTFTKAA